MLKFCSKKSFNLKFLLICLFFCGNMGSFCAYATEEIRAEVPSVKSQVAKILLSSLGGAILGISTLSFYDRPQDHLSNVAVGGVIGVVLGSIYVTRESFDTQAELPSLKEGGSLSMIGLPNGRQYQVQWSFSF